MTALHTNKGFRPFLPYARALQNTGCTLSYKSAGGAISYKARWQNWYATGNFGQERILGSFAVTSSDSDSIFQQQFGENHGDDSCYSIYFDSSTIVWLSGLLQTKSLEWRYLGLLVYYSAKTSRHRQLQDGLWYVPKKILTWMLREALCGLIATVGNRVTTYHFIHIVFCSFLFLSTRVLFSLELG